jgi:hypothetical protein
MLEINLTNYQTTYNFLFFFFFNFLQFHWQHNTKTLDVTELSRTTTVSAFVLCLTTDFRCSNDEWQFETQQKGTVSV